MSDKALLVKVFGMFDRTDVAISELIQKIDALAEYLGVAFEDVPPKKGKVVVKKVLVPLEMLD